MKTKTWINLIVALVLLIASFLVMPHKRPAAQAATIIHVKPGGGTSAGCGSSWANACQLQTALTNASSGDEIWVAAGTYKPGTNRAATFKMKSGVALYGGFAGTETDREQRDWETNPTVLSGDIGVPDDSSDNSHLVVTSSSVDATAILDGFTVSGGNSDIPTYGYGGGMHNSDGSPTLTNVIFSDNYAFDAGGGMYNDGGSPSLTNVTFSGNEAAICGGMYNGGGSPSLVDVIFNHNIGGGMCSSRGSPYLSKVTFIGNINGGMENYDSSPYLTNVIFSENIGGGMSNTGGSPYLTNVTFRGNVRGGMHNDNSNPSLTNVSFIGNKIWSGMINFGGSNPTLVNVTFIGNSAYYGGGMHNSVSSPSLTNVSFNGNTAEYSGGGIYNYGSNPSLTNVIFSSNEADYGGGIYNQESSNPTIANTILWGNTADVSGSQIYNEETSVSSVQYSDVQGGCAAIPGNDCSGGGNIDLDPLFARDPHPGPDGTWGTTDDDYGDLRLEYGSPVIDAGDNTAPGLVGITTDQDGNPRFYDVPGIADTGVGPAPVVDMGAHERQAHDPPTARDDNYNTVPNSPLNIDAPGVLINDINPGGGGLSAVIENGPSIGSLALNPDGSFEYQPKTGYFGVVKFSYRATDGLLYSNIGTVTINVGYVYLPVIMR